MHFDFICARILQAAANPPPAPPLPHPHPHERSTWGILQSLGISSVLFQFDKQSFNSFWTAPVNSTGAANTHQRLSLKLWSALPVTSLLAPNLFRLWWLPRLQQSRTEKMKQYILAFCLRLLRAAAQHPTSAACGNTCRQGWVLTQQQRGVL